MGDLTAIDLFSGAGGLSLGLKLGGFKVLAAVEYNEAAARTYALNHVDTKIYKSDIRDINPEKLMNELGIVPGELDLLAGCPPCQGFSTLKTRNRKTFSEDERNDFVFELLRFAYYIKPKAIMIENVPGLAKDVRAESLIRFLSENDYKVNDRTIQIKDVSDFSVPQRRRRTIIKASKFGFIEDPEVKKNKKTVRETIGEMPQVGASGDFLHDWPAKRSAKVSEIIRNIPKDGGSRSDLPKELWLDCHRRSPKSYGDVYGRMRWDDVAPTITSGCHNPSKGRFIHPDQDRAISLREAALLQTFPDNYKFHEADGKESIALMIGNALPPEFIRLHVEKIYSHLTGL